MVLHRKNHILTLVLTALLWSFNAGASPDSTFEPEQIDTNPIKQQNEPLIPTRQHVKDSTAIGGGVLFGAVSAIDATDSLLYFKLSQSYYVEAETAHEYSLYIISNGQIGWGAGIKWLQGLGSNYEPYFKLAIGALYNPSENLGTLVNWTRYQVTCELGFDDFFKMNRSVRAEVGLSESGLGLSYYAGAVYVF